MLLALPVYITSVPALVRKSAATGRLKDGFTHQKSLPKGVFMSIQSDKSNSDARSQEVDDQSRSQEFDPATSAAQSPTIVSAPDTRTPASLGDLAASLLAARREVDEIFEHEGFAASPAWDIILQAFQAQSREAPVTVTEACRKAPSGPTTALRWIGALEEMQLLERVGDQNDGGMTVIKLTPKGQPKSEQALQVYLKAA
ncbi:winged helix DNA-binding protein [Erythrobacter sp. sf7]|uniref:Winged helix DNA-binding protein n=1 Tax=Erythrobacter fulvus TaxID=2987523 RepID=A0ABT5JQK9_9SPHN|nr:winged helix DNA-binding protein [Erythrobacter fulvus]MDC8753837.1 winged helix DNA-binding protein [Erythrobacter fulvus]